MFTINDIFQSIRLSVNKFRGQILVNINFQRPELENEALRIFDQLPQWLMAPGLSSGTGFIPIGEGRIWLK